MQKSSHRYLLCLNAIEVVYKALYGHYSQDKGPLQLFFSHFLSNA